MNKDQLASVVAAEVGLSQTDAKKAVEAVFNGVKYQGAIYDHPNIQF